MPIRINLKELFPADAQEITIDKINFNFNKLLALGVGEPGPIGISGIQGSAGPVGGTGSQGTRGSTWIVDAGSPTITTGLLDGDLYLDSTALAVWQWDAATSTWNFLFDISAIVQNYLNAAQSPFVRGFGAGSPNDQRFILFGKRDDIVNDSVNNPASTNDVLFLSNYDDAALLPNPPTLGGSPSTSDFYDALLSISVDQRAAGLTRSHIELGAVYNTSDPTLTSLNENFKLRYDRFVGSSVHPYANPSDNHYNRLTLSLDVYNSLSSASRNFSSVFAFQSPKYVSTAPTNTFSSVFIGSRYGLDEEAPSATSGSTLADGIVFATSGSGANIGVAVNYVVPGGIQGKNTGYINNVLSPSQDYFMLDSLGSTDALFLNDKVYQNGGNIVQLGTTAARLTGITGARVLSTISSPVSQSTAMAHQGNKIFSIVSYKSVDTYLNTDNAVYNEITVENVNLPTFHLARDYSATPNTSPGNLDFAGVTDIAVAGDYMYCVKCISLNNTTGTAPKITVQTVKLNEDLDQLPTRQSLLGPSLLLPMLDSLHRIKLRGNLAVVTSNALPILPSVTNLGGTLNPSNTYDGHVVLLNVTCPEEIRLVDYKETSKTSGSTASTRSAIMDMDVVDDLVYALTWEQTPINPTSATVKVKVDAFSIKGADTEPTASISWKTDTSTITGGTFINNSFNTANYDSLGKVGAICANKKYVYAAYPVISGPYYTPELKIFGITGGVNIGIPTNLTLNTVSTLALTLNIGAQINEINKIQQVGNSVYILANTTLNGSYLIKVDVSNPSSPFQVWYKQIDAAPAYYSNFILKGKNIYLLNTGGVSGVSFITTTNSTLTSLEIDGFYTGAAHIESLRAEELDVTQDMKIGNNAIINNELNVGGRAEIVGELGVGTRLRMCGGSYFTGSSGDIIANISNYSRSFIVKGLNYTEASVKLLYGSTQYFELATDSNYSKVKMNLNPNVDLEINTANSKRVKIVSTGNSYLTLETGGGTDNNNFRLYDGPSSSATNEAFRIRTYPASSYVELSSLNGRASYLTTNSANNNIKATSGDVNIFTDTSGDVNVTANNTVAITGSGSGPNVSVTGKVAMVGLPVKSTLVYDTGTGSRPGTANLAAADYDRFIVVIPRIFGSAALGNYLEFTIVVGGNNIYENYKIAWNATQDDAQFATCPLMLPAGQALDFTYDIHVAGGAPDVSCSAEIISTKLGL